MNHMLMTTRKRNRTITIALAAMTMALGKGVASCSAPGLTGWHGIGASAPTFSDGHGCTYRLDQVVDVGSTRVIVTAVAPGPSCPGDPSQAVHVTQVWCVYEQQDLTTFPTILAGDSCVANYPHGLARLLRVDAGYTEPVTPMP